MKRYCDKTAEKLEAIEQARVSGINQVTSLRIVVKSLASSFDKYNTDVNDLLSQKDKDAIGGVIKDTWTVIERCEGTVSQLRALTRKKTNSKSKLDVLRDELKETTSTIQSLHLAFNTLASHPPRQFYI